MATKTDAQDALFDAITKTTEEALGAHASVTARASALRDLALAYRYAAGGQQPGASVVAS